MTLAGREILALFDDGAIQTAIKVIDEGACVDVIADLHHLLIGIGIGIIEGDVVFDGSREQENVLEHLPHRLSQALDLDILDVDAVDEDIAFLRHEVTDDQTQYRGFACARGPNESDRLLGSDMERDVFEDPILVLIGEPYVAELDLAAE